MCARIGVEEDMRHSVQQTLRLVQQEWTGVLGCAEKLRNQAELQDSLDKELQDFHFQEGNVQAWVAEQQQRFTSLDKDKTVQERLHISQVRHFGISVFFPTDI